MHYCLIWSWLDWCGLATATVQALCFLTPDCIVHFQRVSRKMGLGLPTKPENRSSLNSSDACGTLAAIFDKATGSCGAVVNRAQHFSSLRSVTPSPVPVASKRRKLLHRQDGECFRCSGQSQYRRAPKWCIVQSHHSLPHRLFRRDIMRLHATLRRSRLLRVS